MKNLDHIGIAVESIDETLKLYQHLFGFELELREFVPTQNVEVAFVKLENTRLEFLRPTSDQSTLRRFLDKRGPGLHHVCYRVEDIVFELAQLKQRGCALIDEQPRDGAHNTFIAFIHPKSSGGVLTELCQYK